jgi:hypothetical protein
MTLRLQVGALATLLTLAACGGGSGGGTLAPVATDFNLKTGIAGMVAHGLTANVSLSGTAMVNGTSIPYSGSGTYTLAAGTNGTFNGGAALAQLQTIAGTITAAGHTFPPINASVTDYYATTDSAFLGESDGTSGEVDVAQTPITYPTSVVSGSSAVLGTVSRYSDSTLSTSLGTAQISYSAMNSSSAGNPLQITLTTKIYDTTNALTETDTTVYNLSTSNVISFVSGSAQKPQGTLTVTAN